MLEAQTGNRTVGRVLRFDSFSKILSAGIRIGFVTGPAQLLDAIDRHVWTFDHFLCTLMEPLADGHSKPTIIILLSGSNSYPITFMGATRLSHSRSQSC
jgi:hypothetical protein